MGYRYLWLMRGGAYFGADGPLVREMKKLAKVGRNGIDGYSHKLNPM